MTSDRSAHAAVAATRRGFTLVSVGAVGRLLVRQRASNAGGWSGPVPIEQRPDTRAIDSALAASADDALLLTWRSFGKGAGTNRMRMALAADGSGFMTGLNAPVLGGQDPRQGGSLARVADR